MQREIINADMEQLEEVACVDDIHIYRNKTIHNKDSGEHSLNEMEVFNNENGSNKKYHDV